MGGQFVSQCDDVMCDVAGIIQNITTAVLEQTGYTITIEVLEVPDVEVLQLGQTTPTPTTAPATTPAPKKKAVEEVATKKSKKMATVSVLCFCVCTGAEDGW